jgi:ribose transport system permease protein
VSDNNKVPSLGQPFGLPLGKRILSIFITRSETSVIAATIVLCAIFSTSQGFISAYNIFNVSRTAALFIIIAIGQSMVIIIGGMNISLGAIGGLAVICMGYMVQVLHVNEGAAILIGLIIGMTAGFLNGLIVTRFKINAFVATLATSFVFTGLVYGISRGNAFNEFSDAFTFLGRKGFLKMPFLFWIAVAVLCVLFYIFRYTVLGRNMLATGGNEEAARLSGINTGRMVIIANLLSGLFAAIAGMLSSSWLGIAPPSIGQDWMITSFAVSVIGGTLLKGGQFTAIGLLFGGFLIALIKNGLVMLQVNIYFEQTFLGLIILGAVMLESVRTKYLRRV